MPRDGPRHESGTRGRLGVATTRGMCGARGPRHASSRKAGRPPPSSPAPRAGPRHAPCPRRCRARLRAGPVGEAAAGRTFQQDRSPRGRAPARVRGAPSQKGPTRPLASQRVAAPSGRSGSSVMDPPEPSPVRFIFTHHAAFRDEANRAFSRARSDRGTQRAPVRRRVRRPGPGGDHRSDGALARAGADDLRTPPREQLSQACRAHRKSGLRGRMRAPCARPRPPRAPSPPGGSVQQVTTLDVSAA